MSSERLLRSVAAGARAPGSGSGSDASSTLSSDEDQIHDIVADEPLYYVLMQFLMTEDGKNIATVLSELTSEVKHLRLAMDKLAVGVKEERESREDREEREDREARNARRERRAREARD